MTRSSILIATDRAQLLQSGRPSALLRPAAQHGTCQFPGIRRKQALWLVCGQKCRAGAAGVLPVAAVGVYETRFSLVRRAVRGVVRLAGGRRPGLPFAWGLWPVLDGQQCARQIGQRPSWAWWSRRAVPLIGRTALRRRPAQYSLRAGSSGDATPITIGCRTMLVQETLCMKAPLLRSPNTHRSCLALLNLPKYRANTRGAAAGSARSPRQPWTAWRK